MERCKGVDSNEVFVDGVGDDGGEADEEEREGAEEGADKQGMGDQNIQPDSIRFRKIFVQHGRKG